MTAKCSYCGGEPKYPRLVADEHGVSPAEMCESQFHEPAPPDSELCPRCHDYYHDNPVFGAHSTCGHNKPAAPSTPAPPLVCPNCGGRLSGWAGNGKYECVANGDAPGCGWQGSVTAARPEAGARAIDFYFATWLPEWRQRNPDAKWLAGGDAINFAEAYAQQLLAQRDLELKCARISARANNKDRERAEAALAQREAEIARLNTRCAELERGRER